MCLRHRQLSLIPPTSATNRPPSTAHPAVTATQYTHIMQYLKYGNFQINCRNIDAHLDASDATLFRVSPRRDGYNPKSKTGKN